MKNWRQFAQIRLVLICKKEIPAVSLGTSPFAGQAYFGSRAKSYYKKFYENVENIKEIIKKAIELGIPSIQYAMAYERIAQAVKEVQEELQLQIFTSVTIGLPDPLAELDQAKKEAKTLNPQICFTEGQVTDSKRIDLITEIIDTIKEAGMLAGCATHNPARIIPLLDEAGLDNDLWLAPINPSGRFMGPDPQKTLEVIKNTNKPVIGKKVLAAGRINPKEALPYVGQIKNVKGVVIGICSIKEAEETFTLAKKIWPKV